MEAEEMNFTEHGVYTQNYITLSICLFLLHNLTFNHMLFIFHVIQVDYNYHKNSLPSAIRKLAQN